MQFALGKGGGGGKEMFLRLFVTKTVRVDFPENPLCSYTLLMYYRYTAIHSPFQLARSKLSPEFIIVSSGLAPTAMYSFARYSPIGVHSCKQSIRRFDGESDPFGSS